MKQNKDILNMSTARRFNPIFVATVTPATIDMKVSETKGAYTLMQAATVSKEGREDRSLTVMAFGKAHEEVGIFLEPGQPIELAVQHNGGTLKVIGLPHAKAA
jgi:hypothetical protein